MNVRLVDSKERTWSIAITPYEYQIVKRELDLDLYDIVVPVKQVEVFKRLETDDVLLVGVLWRICREEADSRQINEPDFMRGFCGDAIERGYQSIIDALSFFFRNSTHRALMKKLSDFLSEVNKQVEREVIPELKAIDVQEVARKFVESAMSSRESLESTSRVEPEPDGDIRLASSQRWSLEPAGSGGIAH